MHENLKSEIELNSISKCCSHCKNNKPLSKFYKLAHCKYGVSNICKECQSKKGKTDYQKHKESYIKRAKSWAIENREKRRIIVNKSDAKYREKKKARGREYAKNQLINNKEETRLKRRHYAHIRRLRMKVVDTSITPEQIKIIITLANKVCIYCNKKNEKITLDHFIPISKGGDHNIHNLIPCCKSCNSSKNNRNGYDWLIKNNNIEALSRMQKYLSKAIKIMGR